MEKKRKFTKNDISAIVKRLESKGVEIDEIFNIITVRQNSLGIKLLGQLSYLKKHCNYFVIRNRVK